MAMPDFTAGQRQLLALALRLPEEGVIYPADNDVSREDVVKLEMDGWLYLSGDASKGEYPVGWKATPELWAEPWAQTLIDNPFAD
jgi:hypothetical protein